MTTFSDFGLAEPLLRALADEGYTIPTPIQAQAIPPVLAGKDLLGIAQTGTGKTAAFALPILHYLYNNPLPGQRQQRSTRALVLAPTRELAGQIAERFEAYGAAFNVKVGTVYGGMPIGKQERMCASGLDVLVATPGRMLDLIDRRALSLAHVEKFVLDEADQMLDLGFIHALRRVVTLLPLRRQTLFFSATMPSAISDLAGKFLRDPVKVAVAPVATTAERVEQRVMFVNPAEKQAVLTLLLSDPKMSRALVFTRTKHGADRVVKQLGHAGIEAAAIHGNKSQPQRERALDSFRTGHLRVLVATDIAARGIDVPNVSHVVNFELPNVPEQYVHRIGRTARAGADGIAISLCAHDERAYLKDIEKLTRQRVPEMPLPAGIAQAAGALKKMAIADPMPPREDRMGRGDRVTPIDRSGARPFRGARPGGGGGAPRGGKPAGDQGRRAAPGGGGRGTGGGNGGGRRAPASGGSGR